MTIPIAPTAPHTDAVVAAIAAIPMPVERAKKPAGGGWQGDPGTSDYVPYAVVYPSPGVPDGNEAEPLEYLDYSAQINIWGITEPQAERVADLVRAALIGRRLTVAGRSTYRVQTPGGPPIRRDDSVQPSTYLAVVEIAFRSQPA
ncbi:hypothetical protein OG884_05770 [Streptosporangium sp. NBC_01755]|uniref:tail completion protein gp17 n=1 Tax=Streptosporangium sp. NBC_01755 TaxID=2975949 RepID=UPI002DDB095D|nr:hypothetical protein [Streptosporangium sp. NBC_01755]WSD01433.1 hypothetical protein OG884_05770 [Streptosporangium sp. NBC_01755]